MSEALPSVFLEELSTRQAEIAIQAGFDTVVIMLGAQEQHGPHLPLSTDALWGREIGGRVARALGDALVAPTLAVGVSPEHVGFAGTMSIRQETFTATLVDYVASLERSGFNWIAFLPSHGGNVEPLEASLAAFEAITDRARLLAFTDLYGLIAVGAEVGRQFGLSPEVVGAHAGEWETSMVLALRPELVDADHLAVGYLGDLEPVFAKLMSEGMQSVTPNGILGDARPATAEHGRVYLDSLADFYARWIREQRDANTNSAQ